MQLATAASCCVQIGYTSAVTLSFKRFIDAGKPHPRGPMRPLQPHSKGYIKMAQTDSDTAGMAECAQQHADSILCSIRFARDDAEMKNRAAL